MRQLLKATLILPLLLGTLTPALAAADQAPPDANDINPPIETPATPPLETSVTPPAGNTGDIGNATSGKTLPLTLKLSELGDNWRQLTISPQIESTDKAGHDLNNAFNKAGADPDADMQKLTALLATAPGIYFTQGQTVTTGDASFLVAYHAPFDAQEFRALFPDTKPDSVEGVMRVLEKYLRQRTLDLALLNLHQVGTMSNIQPFSMDTQIAKLRAFVAHSYETDGAHENGGPHSTPPPAPATNEDTANQNGGTENASTEDTLPASHGNGTVAHGNAAVANAISAVNNSSVARLQSIGAGLQNYLEDHDGVLPPMQNAGVAKAALKNYASESIFIHPGTKEAYLPNAILSGKKLAHITNPVAMVAFYEAHPAADGKRALLFLDGHVKRIKEAEWPLVKRACRIP